MDVDTDVKQLEGEGNQEELTIGDVKDASIDEEKAINFTGGTTTSHSPSMKFRTVEDDKFTPIVEEQKNGQN